jgi:small membrane protein
MNLFQSIFVPLCALLAIHAVLRLWRRRVPRRWGMFQVVAWTAAAGLIARPDATLVLASWLGIGRGADLVMYLAVLAGLFACYYFYDRYRRMEILLTDLVRGDAIDRAEEGRDVPPATEGENHSAARKD